MNKVYKVTGFGHYVGGQIIVAAPDEETALLYANASAIYDHNNYREAEELEMLGEIEFDGIVAQFEYAE